MKYVLNTTSQPGQEITIEESTVFLGINGSGKSASLKYIGFQLSNDQHIDEVIYIEGGRLIALSDNVGTNLHPNQIQSLEETEKSYMKQKKFTLMQRINYAFEVMIQRGEKIWRDHSKAIQKWSLKKEGHPPGRQELPLEKLFSLFSEVFPSISLEYNDDIRRFTCFKNGSEGYSISQLSDGEKQVLLCIAEIAVLKGAGGVVLVDEPELNLHGSLASRFWSLLEDDCPDTTFIYATHDIAFCMRENVKRIYVLDNFSTSVTEIKGIPDIPPAQLQSFLGVIPGILSAKRVLLTEGKADSFDPVFYRWVTGEKSLQIIPLGGCEDVKAVSGRQEFWSRISTTVSLSGVIDRDYRPDIILQSLSMDNITVLDFHEAESYLCMPEIVEQLMVALGLVENTNIQSKIRQEIVEHFKAEMVNILAQRISYRTRLPIGELSIPKIIIREISDTEELKQEFFRQALVQKEYAESNLSDSAIEVIFEEEQTFLNNMLLSSDILHMLKIASGKSLLRRLVCLSGVRSPMEFLRACTKHLKPIDFPHLSSLRYKLNQLPV